MKYLRNRQSNSHFTISTIGLAVQGQSEISVLINENLIEEAERFLKHVSDYVLDSPMKVQPEDTMGYGYWLVKFREIEQHLEVWEYDPNASNFVIGADLTLTYWKDQHFICDQHTAIFDPPRPDKMTVVSAGVIEGLPVQGLRYVSSDRMSGWWITTDLYDGDTTSLRHEHTYHVTAARPELAKYLALPEGFRFNFSIAEEVWFDENVL